jgi:asparagine synthase (glutamine-hydrolysing)
VDLPALGEYFAFQNILSDRTLFSGIHQLEPGHLMAIRLGDDLPPKPRKYWDYPFKGDPQPVDTIEASEELRRLFEQAVTRQLISDVPVGSYLSGGLDSGAIAAVATKTLPRLRTFTCGFDLSSASGLEMGFDERVAAEAMASRLRTEHYEVVLHAGDMEWVLPKLIWHLEDLRVGQSYPNFYVAGLASRFVTVVLSGSGGDELFAGYPWRYQHGINATSRDDFMQSYFTYWQRLVPAADHARLFTGSARNGLGDATPFERFRQVFSGFAGQFLNRQDFLAAARYFELKTFLPGLLTVEDKLSMAHSLEARVPFLDNDLVDFSVGLPSSVHLREGATVGAIDENDALGARKPLAGNDGKALFRTAMELVVPPAISGRPKQGFSAPDASWFRGESIAYIERTLGNRKAMTYEFLDPGYVRKVMDEHISGQVNHRLLIWSLLCFEWWCRVFLSDAAADRLDVRTSAPRGIARHHNA